MYVPRVFLLLGASIFSSALPAQDEVAELSAKGKDLYFQRVSCWVCHGDNAEGRLGPTLHHGPTPMDIQEQLEWNPQMGVIVAELKPTAEDLVALATYIGELGGNTVTVEQVADWRMQLVEMEAARGRVLRTPATLLKVDALALQPIKQLSVGGRTHHAQVFQDRYLLVDTFVSEPDGLDIFLLDPETDQIVGGVRSEDLGGSNYTAFTDDEFIYVLMQPGGDGGAIGGAASVANGQMTMLRPFWVAKIDPENWEVVAEYPARGNPLLD